MRGGKRPQAGRKKGSINKSNKAIRDQVAATGVTPEFVMIDNMRHAYAQALEIEANIGPDMLKSTDDPAEQFQRLMTEVKRAVGYRQVAQECAKDAAPYCHPRLASTEVTGKDGGPLIVQVLKFAHDQDPKQLAASPVSSEGLGLSGKGRETSLPRLASTVGKG